MNIKSGSGAVHIENAKRVNLTESRRAALCGRKVKGVEVQTAATCSRCLKVSRYG